MKVLFSAELDHSPFRELTMQGLPEPLTVFKSRPFAGSVAMRFAVQIYEGERARFATEMFHIEFQTPRPLQAHRRYAPDQGALFVPALDCHVRRALI